MIVHVTGAALKAALLHAAKKDIRFYLNGVCIEAHEKETRVIGTDGHRAAVIRVPTENVSVSPGTRFIIPRATVEAMKISKAALKHPIVIEGPNDNGEYRATGVFGVAIFQAVEGVFPDYRHIIPETTSGTLAQYNPAYLADMAKAAELLGHKFIYVEHNGDGPARVTVPHYSDFVGVVMPVRSDKAEVPDTSWARA
ncbi:DNA polymerase III beta subunit, central domain protein [Burkholderia thailandensis MSMB121]|uniref:DNA polymerase III subunit beta family protein n=1 Tax=Burkholderia humptydooensis TaxID=430531 RepID=UPI000327EF65|nr:DNA polymerase III subunit beta, central domain protein [Burkholderia humptydooensis]AGK49418.1 DNA polymerase III beta subunit, central domain protein [Burkholderia thailandensis MSMB121]ATF36671.1 DNA polymerase III subunit beta [Burkholderia thailandensis]KST74049.1 DNA polymerase III subunit beta [Burkholderia humptydooensis]